MAWLPAFTPAELKAAADEAHALGRKIGIHCCNARSMENAVEAGADQIEHAQWTINAGGAQVFEPAVAEKIARAGTWVCPTLSIGTFVKRSLAAKKELTALDRSEIARWGRTVDELVTYFGKMREAGVRFAAGNDAGWRHSPFDSFADELILMNEGGLSTMDTIVSATGGAAQALGLAERTGTIKPGMLADIIAVEGNPLDSLSCLRDVAMVMKDGKRASLCAR
jgi:imidazolonepropionase-like amidohydrolase